MDNQERAVAKEPWSPPVGATAVIMWLAGMWRGYQFVTGPGVRINRRVIEYVNSDGNTLTLMGASIIERILNGEEKSIDDALWGIFTEKEFAGTRKEYDSSVRYVTHYDFHGKAYFVCTINKVSILSESSFSLDDSGSLVTISGENMTMVCEQIRKNDDNGDFDLSDLPDPTGALVIPHK